MGVNIADMEDIQILTDPNVRSSSVFAGGSEVGRGSRVCSVEEGNVFVDLEP